MTSSPAPPSPDAPTGNRAEIPAEAVRAQLDKLVRSPILVQSAQLCRFLHYVVERKLAGDVDSLKENVLGIEVFDRGDRFDPRRDSVVRVEARRLRAKLEEYYKGEGASDAVVIRMPKGEFTCPISRCAESRRRPNCPPHSVRRGSLPADCGDARCWRRFCSPWVAYVAPGSNPRSQPRSDLAVAVLPFVNADADPETDYYADGLTEDLIDSIGRTGGLRLVARSSVFQYQGTRSRRQRDRPQAESGHPDRGQLPQTGPEHSRQRAIDRRPNRATNHGPKRWSAIGPR